MGALKVGTYKLTVKVRQHSTQTKRYITFASLHGTKARSFDANHDIRQPQVLVAPDDAGTYEIRVNQANMVICDSANTGCSSSKSADPPQGTVDTYTLQVCKDSSLEDCSLTPSSECQGVL